MRLLAGGAGELDPERPPPTLPQPSLGSQALLRGGICVRKVQSAWEPLEVSFLREGGESLSWGEMLGEEPGGEQRQEGRNM